MYINSDLSEDQVVEKSSVVWETEPNNLTTIWQSTDSQLTLNIGWNGTHKTVRPWKGSCQRTVRFVDVWCTAVTFDAKN